MPKKSIFSKFTPEKIRNDSYKLFGCSFITMVLVFIFMRVVNTEGGFYLIPSGVIERWIFAGLSTIWFFSYLAGGLLFFISLFYKSNKK